LLQIGDPVPLRRTVPFYDLTVFLSYPDCLVTGQLSANVKAIPEDHLCSSNVLQHVDIASFETPFFRHRGPENKYPNEELCLRLTPCYATVSISCSNIMNRFIREVQAILLYYDYELPGVQFHDYLIFSVGKLLTVRSFE
jgi:hypothetical protein